MIVKKDKFSIVISNPEYFDVKQTLLCGQVFSYEKLSDTEFVVISKDKIANVKIICETKNIVIQSKDIDYFYNYFDLNTNYEKIANDIKKISPQFKDYINFGKGIRILKQDEFQTIISFLISQNNNIKRIKSILFKISQKYGCKIEGSNYYAFPTLNQLTKATEQDFKTLGAGYRSSYLVKSLKMLNTKEYDIDYLKTLQTPQLKQKLMGLNGVGPKVADCILFFGFARTDVFPVDTWIKKSYSLFESNTLPESEIAKYFVNKFGMLSGYAQQYLYNYVLYNNVVKNS